MSLAYEETVAVLSPTAVLRVHGEVGVGSEGGSGSLVLSPELPLKSVDLVLLHLELHFERVLLQLELSKDDEGTFNLNIWP